MKPVAAPPPPKLTAVMRWCHTELCSVHHVRLYVPVEDAKAMQVAVVACPVCAQCLSETETAAPEEEAECD